MNTNHKSVGFDTIPRPWRSQRPLNVDQDPKLAARVCPEDEN